MANFFFWLISVACKSHQAFDVTHCMHWGGTVERAAVQSVKVAPQQISEWIKRYHLSADRAQAMQGFLNAAAPYMHELDGLQLVSDGSYIGIVIDGTAKPLDQKGMSQMISQLTACEAHSIIVNLGNSEQEKSQFLLLLPIRIPNKSINLSPLKGFVILRKMNRTASDQVSDPTQQSA